MSDTAMTRVSMFELISCLSRVIDLVCPELDTHHDQVGYIAYCLALELGMEREARNELYFAAKLHDVGALSLSERISTLEFEDSVGRDHAEKGFALLKTFAPLAGSAELVRYHHLGWDGGLGKSHKGREVPLGSHIVHLADRVAVSIRKGENLLDQAKGIVRNIADHSDGMFRPDAVAAFRKLATKDSFWFELSSRNIGAAVNRTIREQTVDLDGDTLLSLTQLFARIIDFRSHFTANHSSGVAASAAALARLAGCSQRECRLLMISGYLHDLGKLAVPAEILEKEGNLTSHEVNVIHIHPFHTFRALEEIGAFSEIAGWSAYHHEHLNGRGYPFRLAGAELNLGSRIVAVADNFTAVTEDRPYRNGMEAGKALEVLRKMAQSQVIDSDLMEIVEENFAELNGVRVSAQQAAGEEYRRFAGTLAQGLTL